METPLPCRAPPPLDSQAAWYPYLNPPPARHFRGGRNAYRTYTLLGPSACSWSPRLRRTGRNGAARHLNGISTEKNLPVRWSTTENVAWKLAMPSKTGATPIIWGNNIFLNVADGDDLYLWCVDKTKGTPIWKKLIAGGNYEINKQNMSSPSPVTDGTNVFVLTGVGVLKGFDFAGNELWVRDIQKDYGKFGLNWGYGSSPLLHEDSLYVQVLHGMKTDDPSYLLRIDKKTGKTVWRVERPTEATERIPRLLPDPGAGQVSATGWRSWLPTATASPATTRPRGRNCGARGA